MIPVYKPSITEVEKAYVMKCLDEGWISSKGRFIEQFENEFREYVGSKHAVSVSNGTTALHTALLALGIGPGDEVLIPTLTYIASANAVTYTGAKPVFIDSDRHTWNIDPNKLQEAITSKTKAIMAVHLYGLPCDMAAINMIARMNGLYVIEDCAEAIGSKINGQHVGTFGDVSSFSFYGNKTITTGEGGMVVTNNEEIAKKASKIKGQGLSEDREYYHDIIGYNYRMTNICAAIGCAQMQNIEKTISDKLEIAYRYKNNLNGILEFQQVEQGLSNSYWMVSGLLKSDIEVQAVRSRLNRLGIETRPVFNPIHSMPMYDDGKRYCNAGLISFRGLNLPSWPGLSNEHIDYICEVLITSL